MNTNPKEGTMFDPDAQKQASYSPLDVGSVPAQPAALEELDRELSQLDNLIDRLGERIQHVLTPDLAERGPDIAALDHPLTAVRDRARGLRRLNQRLGNIIDRLDV